MSAKQKITAPCGCCGELTRFAQCAAIYISRTGAMHPYVLCDDCVRLPLDQQQERVELRFDKAAGHA